MGKFQSGVVLVEHGRQGLRSRKESTIRASVWLQIFINKVGDHMPTDGSTHLPSCLTRSDVYELAREDLSQDGTPVCSRSTFFELWRREFQHVKIPPVNFII